jgi:hypothetical protein
MIASLVQAFVIRFLFLDLIHIGSTRRNSECWSVASFSV